MQRNNKGNNKGNNGGIKEHTNNRIEGNKESTVSITKGVQPTDSIEGDQPIVSIAKVYKEPTVDIEGVQPIVDIAGVQPIVSIEGVQPIVSIAIEDKEPTPGIAGVQSTVDIAGVQSTVDIAGVQSTVDIATTDANTQRASYVYLLMSSSGNTYVGATNNLDRRLRQHNKEIAGGAHATGTRVSRGETWTRIAYVSGFPNWQAALQFEWRWKQVTRKIHATTRVHMDSLGSVRRRFMALKILLEFERPTTKAIPYAEWPTPPKVNIEPSPANVMEDMWSRIDNTR